MVTKRVPLNRATRAKLTPQVVAMFITVCEIYDAELEKIWEENGGRHDEYHQLRAAINNALGRQPWQMNPCSVDPEWVPTPFEVGRDFAGACMIRLALEEAAAEMTT